MRCPEDVRRDANSRVLVGDESRPDVNVVPLEKIIGELIGIDALVEGQCFSDRVAVGKIWPVV